jgi:hypothetical protein
MRRRTVTAPVAVPVPVIGLVVACLVGLGGMLLPAAAAAATPGNISGTVTDASASGHPGIEGARICATLTTAPKPEPVCETALSDGQYTIAGLVAGHYEVEFTGQVCREACTLEYVKQVYSVEVESGQTAEVNAELLEIAGKISGQVTAGGSPLEGIDVCAFGTRSGGCAQTDSDGEYTIEHIMPGSYEVSFRPHDTCEIICQPSSNYISQYWNAEPSLEAADAVVVKESATTDGVDAELQVGGHISGKVSTASIYPEPIPNLVVCAMSTAVNKQGERVGMEVEEQEAICSLTNAAGEYSIPTLATGGYEVEFKGELCVKESLGVRCTHPYIDQVYQSIVWVAAPGTTSGVDAGLLEVSPTKPVNTGAPMLTGTPQAGKRLSCSQGSWANRPTGLAYRWLRNGVAIPNQTAATYTVQRADEGYGIACEAIASNGAGAAASTSNTLAIPKLPPGVAVVLGVKVHGAKASVKLGCTGLSACSGKLKIVAWVTTGHRRHTKTYRVPIGHAPFAMDLGKRLTLHVHLVGGGAALVTRAGRRGLRAQIAGSGVQAHRAVLRKPKRRR